MVEAETLSKSEEKILPVDESNVKEESPLSPQVTALERDAWLKERNEILKRLENAPNNIQKAEGDRHLAGKGAIETIISSVPSTLQAMFTLKSTTQIINNVFNLGMTVWKIADSFNKIAEADKNINTQKMEMHSYIEAANRLQDAPAIPDVNGKPVVFNIAEKTAGIAHCNGLIRPQNLSF